MSIRSRINLDIKPDGFREGGTANLVLRTEPLGESQELPKDFEPIVGTNIVLDGIEFVLPIERPEELRNLDMSMYGGNRPDEIYEPINVPVLGRTGLATRRVYPVRVGREDEITIKTFFYFRNNLLLFLTHSYSKQPDGSYDLGEIKRRK